MTKRVENNFTLTARAFDKITLDSSNSSNPFAMDTNEFIPEYISTVSQTTVLAKNENNAIRNTAMASFVLGKSSPLNKYNEMMRMIQRDMALAK